MRRIVDMIQTHPREPMMDAAALAACIEACYDCAQACTTCADACLGEENVAEVVRCIRTNEDCAAVCLATGAMLSRLTEANPAILRAQVEACLVACRECGEECGQHADHMEHCRVCAEVCRACESACRDLLGALDA